jgi:hypothetical protein
MVLSIGPATLLQYPKCSFQDHKYVYILFATLYNGIVNQALTGFDGYQIPDPKKSSRKGATIGETEL